MDRLEDQFWDFVQDRLPYSWYDALYASAGHVSTVFHALNRLFTYAYKATTGTQQVETLSITEQILPPLLSIVAIYFGLISIYRTTASLVRTTVSIVKWASIIALLALGAGYFAGQGNIDTGLLLRLASQFAVPQERVFAPPEERTNGRGTYGGRTQTQRGQQRRPGIFDSFINHQEWKDGQARAEDTQEYIQQVVKGAQKVYKDGSGFLDLLFGSRQDDNGDDDGSKRETRSQTRRRRKNDGR